VSRQICAAALGAIDTQRLRPATTLLASHAQGLQVSEWRGAHCSAVVVNVDTTYGQQVREQALARRITVLGVSRSQGALQPAHPLLPSGAGVPRWVEALHRTLDAFPGSNPGSPQSAVGVGLLELASESWRGKNIVATQGARQVTIWGNRSRVCAQTLSDLLAASDRFATPGWTFKAAHPDMAPGHVSTSLDAFAFLAAWRQRDVLPSFQANPGRLRAWPDLGTAQDATLALRLANALRRAAHTLETLRTALGSPREINACLWAFQAANLLTDPFVPYESKSAPQRSAPASTPLLARLAARFGLSWATA